MRLIERVQNGQLPGFSIYDGILRFGPQLCVPTFGDLKDRILREAHTFVYTIHPGANKMYQDLRVYYWWSGMKRDVADFVARCLMMR